MENIPQKPLDNLTIVRLCSLYTPMTFWPVSRPGSAMTDIELTQEIDSLVWEVDLSAGTVKSDLVHYSIIKTKEYADLESIWIHPDVPAVISIINQLPDSAVNAYQAAEKKANSFPKTEKIEFRLRQDLADKLPREKAELQKFLASAVEMKLSFIEQARKAGSVRSEKKAKSSAENGKKARKLSDFELEVTKDGKPRTLKLVNTGARQYKVAICYPVGDSVLARFQPPPGSIPDIRYWAKKNGFEVNGENQ
jgi:hypothetical protein